MTSQSGHVALGDLAKTAGAVALVSAGANAAVWLGFGFFGSLAIGVTEVLVASVVGVIAAAVVLAMLVRWTRQPRRIFIGIAIGVLVIYTLGPISAALAPYREGAQLFDVRTVIATELMHVVSGLLVIATFPRLTNRSATSIS